MFEHDARAFDLPVDSPEHRYLAEYGWVGGTSITIRYWLGRLLQRNLFRESEKEVMEALRQYFVARGQVKGALVVADYQAWGPLSTLLRFHMETAIGIKPKGNPRLARALDAVMSDPSLTNAQLAELANTTEKQIARMSDVFLLRKIWGLRKVT